MTRPLISRRAVLRGLAGGGAVALALPPLEGMFRSARADVRDAAPIFGVYFWGNGLPWNEKHTASAVPDPAFNPAYHRDDWTPAQVGATYAATPLLAPIARHQPTVITGLEPKTTWVTGGETDGHMRGFMVTMTSDRIRPEGFDHPSHTLTASRESIDQVVAKHPSFYGANLPRFRSLELGVSDARFHTYGHWNAISYNGPNSLNPPISDAGQLYDRLFAAPVDASATTRRVRLLDAVLDDAQRLQSRLGAADRLRLEAHLDGVYELQRQVELSNVSCGDPGRPGTPADLLARTTTLARLLAVALSCGLTRVFSFMYSSPATTHVFWAQGASNDMHTTCHNGEWDVVRRITEQQITAMGLLLDELAAVEVIPGVSARDAVLLYGTSEYGEGWKHGVQEMPVLLAGGAAGRLRQGWHVREPSGNLAKAHLTMLQALGLPFAQFGFNGSETGDVFTDLVVP